MHYAICNNSFMNRNDAIAAVRANPKNPDAWARLGTFLAEAGDADKATECFMRALRIDGTCTEAKSGLAALHKVSASHLVFDDPMEAGKHSQDTRAWSPMTHILLANHQLTLDEVRALEAESAFGVSASHNSNSLSWLGLALFPLVLWAFAWIFYTLTPIAESLTTTAPAARFLALGSLGIAVLMILGVATYGGRRLGGVGQVLVGVAWVVWLVSTGMLLAQSLRG
jgi:tetratricopeptide (TPR) repeat protein